MTGFAAFDPDRYVGDPPAVPAVVAPSILPGEWAHGISLLRDAARPPYASASRWGQIIADAVLFAETRGQEAFEAGWSLGNLFGFDVDQVDGLVGMVLDIRGGRVLRIERDVAVIQHARGCRFHYRRMPDDARLLWQLAGINTGARR